MLFLLGAGLIGASIANSDDDEIREQAKTQALVEIQTQAPKQQNVCPAGYVCNWETNTIIKLPTEEK